MSDNDKPRYFQRGLSAVWNNGAEFGAIIFTMLLIYSNSEGRGA
ncbi:hypothetical protein [Photorhabdus luminescens]|nr:hypothetical protein [Photorhabdus luminescens]MCW7761111.1 hypothetical protein [Photorhabdus luminescens subsp. venezuelensis]